MSGKKTQHINRVEELSFLTLSCLPVFVCETTSINLPQIIKSVNINGRAYARPNFPPPPSADGWRTPRSLTRSLPITLRLVLIDLAHTLQKPLPVRLLHIRPLRPIFIVLTTIPPQRILLPRPLPHPSHRSPLPIRLHVLRWRKCMGTP